MSGALIVDPDDLPLKVVKSDDDPFPFTRDQEANLTILRWRYLQWGFNHPEPPLRHSCDIASRPGTA